MIDLRPIIVIICILYKSFVQICTITNNIKITTVIMILKMFFFVYCVEFMCVMRMQ